MFWFYVTLAVVGYLLGSFPTGYLVGRSRGIDIREHGSGNIGATNVVRVLGKRPGYFVFVCDVLKGWLSVTCGEAIVRWGFTTVYGPTEARSLDVMSGAIRLMVLGGILAALGCILGHNFPVWLRFRGGKGVATTVGVLLGLMPAAIGVSAAVWFASFYAFRYVSLASMLGAAALPVAVWFLTTRHANPGLNNPLLWFSLAAACLIFWRHRANISRLLNGTEARFGRKPPSPAA